MTLRTVADLVDRGLVPVDETAALEAVAARYAVALTPALAAVIGGGPDDPIAAQFVPHVDELSLRPEERLDPIGDAPHTPVPGIVHRYADRCLLKVVQVCAVYCRFCFRREAVGPGQDAVLQPEALDAALGYIAETPAIWEVILTGGDPLLLSPRRLAGLMDRLKEIEHVRVVRIHTRLPVADPTAIDDGLVAALKRFDRAVFVALHANHARELTDAAVSACARLVDAGIPMLGQSVLLRGINDTPATLEALMRRMVEARIKPYYLHHADLAPGTHRFRTSVAEGQELVDALRGDVSGLCQPTYVLDIPGGFGKVPLARSAASGIRADGSRVVIDRHGLAHLYPDCPHQSCG